MVTTAEFEGVRKILSDSAPSRPFESAELLFTGLIRCGNCSSAITAHSKIQVRCSRCRYKSSVKNRQECSRCGLALSEMKQPQTRRYTYYHCTRTLNSTCREKCISGAVLAAQVRDKIRHFRLAEELKVWGLTFIQSLRDQEIDQREQILREKRKLLAQCSARLENLLKLKTSPENINGSLISDEEYQTQRSELLAQKNSLSDNAREFETNLERKVRVTGDILKFVAGIGNDENGEIANAREVLRALGSNHVLTNKNLVVKPEFPFSELPPANDRSSSESPPIEPGNIQRTQERFGQFTSSRPFQERDSDKDRTKLLKLALLSIWKKMDSTEPLWDNFNGPE